MNSKIKGRIVCTFVRGGISKEKKNPYLQVSDGVEAIFITIPKTLDIDSDTFSTLERGEQITLDVEVDVFANRTYLVDIV